MSIKWECGSTNAVVARRLLPLIVLGYYLLKSFLSSWCIKNCLNFDQQFFSFLLAGQMMVGTFQESCAHVMVSSFAYGSLFWSRS